MPQHPRVPGSPQPTWHHLLLAWTLGLAALMMLLPGGASAQTGTWSTTTDLDTARARYSATLLSSGKVLVAGGLSSSNSSLGGAELYDPVTGAWNSTLGAMNTPRYNHTATLLPNGKVLVVGGLGGSGAFSSAELYDPVAGTWTNTGSMNSARYIHTATLLPSGKVLVAGGNNNAALTSAELYDPVAGTWSSTTGPMNFARYAHTATPPHRHTAAQRQGAGCGGL